MIGYIDPDQIRPYLEENAQTRPILQAKLRRATSVLWWVTTREYVVLYFCFALYWTCKFNLQRFIKNYPKLLEDVCIHLKTRVMLISSSTTASSSPLSFDIEDHQVWMILAIWSSLHTCSFIGSLAHKWNGKVFFIQCTDCIMLSLIRSM